jgi:hypothetical protein
MNPPILEAEEIPYDPADMGPGSFVLEIEFSREEMARLKAGTPRPVRLTRWIKQAALERADREAERHADDDLREAD